MRQANERKKNGPLSIYSPLVRLFSELTLSMQYILLIHLSENWSTLSKEEKNRVHTDCSVWHEALVKSGRSRTAAGLQDSSTAMTVRERNGQAVITDGPFAETKEVLGGFEIVECQNADEALAIAKEFPALRVGAAVEVRPLIEGGTCHEE